MRKKTLVILAISLIALMIIIYVVGLKVQFILSEQMDLDMTPTTVSMELQNGGSKDINFSIETKSPAVCKAKCSYELKDISHESILKEGEFYGQKKFRHEFTAPARGEGQVMYNLNIECSNIKSRLCSGHKKKYYKTSLITLNHNLSSEQRELKKELKERLTEYTYNLSRARALAEEINRFPFTKKITINSNVRTILELWQDQEHKRLQENFSTLELGQYREKNEEVKEKAKRINEKIKKIKELPELKPVYEFYNRMSSPKVREVYDFRNNLFSEIQLLENYEYSNFTIDAESIMDNYTKDLEREKNKLNSTINTLIRANDIAGRNISFEGEDCRTLERVNNFTDKNNPPRNESNQSISRIIMKKARKDNLTVNESMMLENESLLNRSYIETEKPKFCMDKDTFISFNFSIPEKIDIPESEPENISIPKVTNECCIYSECEACSRTGNRPVLFIHGHAISEKNRPEMSHEAFSKIQKNLEEEGYINAGQIGGEHMIRDLPYNEWGKMNARVAVRGSYYQLAYYDIGNYKIVTQKSDSIENYAIRLKDLIEIVRHRTGAEEIDIVAHSMGGLVSRKYLSLFGEKRVNKLILVGTPNRGIEGRVKRLCSVTGASRECNDMKKGSVFLRKLDNFIPTDTEIYTIRGIGCDMNKGKGDGIVLADNVPLEYAENFQIKGKCTDTLNSDLHTRMLDPREYPVTYRTIKSLLLDNPHQEAEEVSVS
ncbi:MAG: lipase family alpha/beta hydrolase [Nanobdellota archaeon]